MLHDPLEYPAVLVAQLPVLAGSCPSSTPVRLASHTEEVRAQDQATQWVPLADPAVVWRLSQDACDRICFKLFSK